MKYNFLTREESLQSHFQKKLLGTCSFLALIAKLFGSFICLLSLSTFPKALKSMALTVVVIRVVGVKADGLVVRCKSLLVPLELIESMALIVIGRSVVGVEADGLVVRCKSLLVPLELIESIALI